MNKFFVAIAVLFSLIFGPDFTDIAHIDSCAYENCDTLVLVVNERYCKEHLEADSPKPTEKPGSNIGISGGGGLAPQYDTGDRPITTKTPGPTATPKPQKTPESDPYNAKDYWDPEDFYEDYYDEFFDFDDAEYYWETHQ
ncbi:MAG: hypothetical protein Q4C42_00310 [Clostridia bacterium]|nr:hypothetical protein [Clostridia bacterium]